jgi:hypothetical protein
MLKLIRRIGLLVPTKEEEKYKNRIRGNFGTYAARVCDGDNDIEEYEQGWSCENHGGREKCV